MAAWVMAAATMMSLSGDPLPTFAFDSAPGARYTVLNLETGQAGPVQSVPDSAVLDDHVALIADIVQSDSSLLASAARPVTFRFLYAPLGAAAPTSAAAVSDVEASPDAVSPWLTFMSSDHGVEVLVHVSEHRVLADAVARREGRIETATPLFADGALLTNACLNQFLIGYEEWAADGRTGDVAASLEQTAHCMPSGVFAGLIYAATSARQVFLAPFGQSFMRRVDDVRDASRPFYRRLYSMLIRQGFARLGAASRPADSGWWKAAAAQADQDQ